MSINNERSYNDGYTHEVLHLVSTLNDVWERHVVETACADQFPDVKAAAEKIADAITALCLAWSVLR